MHSLLIAQPIPRKSDIKRLPPTPIVRELVPRSAQTSVVSDSAEEMYNIKLIACFFGLIILPAILMLLYIALNPQAFTTDITPKIDFSTWQPGQRP